MASMPSLFKLPVKEKQHDSPKVASTLRTLSTSPYKLPASPPGRATMTAGSSALLMSPMRRPTMSRRDAAPTKPEAWEREKAAAYAKARFARHEDDELGSLSSGDESPGRGSGARAGRASGTSSHARSRKANLKTHSHSTSNLGRRPNTSGETLRKCHACDGDRPSHAPGSCEASSATRRPGSAQSASAGRRVRAGETSEDRPSFLKSWDPSHKDMKRMLVRFPFHVCVACREVVSPIAVGSLVYCPYGVHGHVLKPCSMEDLVGVTVPDGYPKDPKTPKVKALDLLQVLPLRVDRAEDSCRTIISKLRTASRLLEEVEDMQAELRSMTWGVNSATRAKIFQAAQPPVRPGFRDMSLALQDVLSRMEDPHFNTVMQGRTEIELFHDLFLTKMDDL